MENGCVICVRAVTVDAWTNNVPISAAIILMDIMPREIAGNPVTPVVQVTATTRKCEDVECQLHLSIH
jgi:hypothetical protein